MALFKLKRNKPSPPAAAPAPAPAALNSLPPKQQLRLARQQAQRMLAELLHVQPAAVLKLEKRTDMYLATLRSHVEAQGGTLEVVAKFPAGEVRLNGLADTEEPD